jgi:hypothetical protein
LTNYFKNYILKTGQSGYIDRRKRMPWDDYPEALTYFNFSSGRKGDRKMKVNEILELGKLGFTKNEIIGILNTQNMTGLNQITSPQGTEQIQNLGQQVANTPLNLTAQTGQDTTNAALLTAINTLTATLQAGNLSASGKSVNASRTSENVAEDLMKLMN